MREQGRCPTPQEIEELVTEVLERNHKARIIGVGVGPNVTWSGPSSLCLGDVKFQVAQADSLREFLGLLASHDVHDERLLLLVGVDDRELRLDIRARLAGRQLLALEPERVVQSRFRVFDLD